MKIFEEIKKEREYQDSKWGSEFDDKNTINDWVAYINIYLGKAIIIDRATFKPDKKQQRTNILKVATLATAALEAFDRNDGFPPRHYDKSEK